MGGGDGGEAGYRNDIPSYYFLNPLSSTSVASEHPHRSWPHPPTLHATRDSSDSIVRRRSSKKKRPDYEREREIKMMTMPAPGLPRPATHAGGPVLPSSSHGERISSRRAFRQRNLSEPQVKRRERPLSDTLPLDPGVLPSFAVASPDYPVYKVRRLEMLSPRPRITYSDPFREPSHDLSLSPSGSKRGKQPPIPEETINEKRRVDDLADSLDTKDIRQLMERDQRRRERKRKADESKVQLLLERPAEKQHKGDDTYAGGTERPNVSMMPPSSYQPPPLQIPSERHLETEHIAADVDQPSTGPPAASAGGVGQRADASESPLSWLQDPSVENLPNQAPAAKDEGTRSGETGEPTPTDDHEEPVIGTAQAVRLSQASVSPMSSPKPMMRPISSISQVTDPFREGTATMPEPTEVETRTPASSPRPSSTAGAWMSFFRRGVSRAKRESSERDQPTPSEFSNTSRDSLSRQPLPASVRSSFQRSSGPPMRTTSKFREELPGLPLSPPDSRLQSPELVPASSSAPVANRVAAGIKRDRDSSQDPRPDGDGGGAAAAGSSRIVRARPELYSSPTITERSPTVAMAKSPRDDVRPVHRHRSIEAPSIEGKAVSTALSLSMASIDSEGSWLSGKPAKRTSLTQPFTSRHSASSLQPDMAEASDLGEELGLAEDEYFSRLTPGLEYDDQRLGRARKPSSAAIASSDSEGEGDGDDDDDDDVRRTSSGMEHGTWHGAIARHPTVVHHASRARSREGLLNVYDEQETEEELEQEQQEHEQELERDTSPVEASLGGERHSGDGEGLTMGDSPMSDAQQSFEYPADEAFRGGAQTNARAEAGAAARANATSLDEGTRQHLRHISAGSARLLDIMPRGSSEKRRSTASTQSGHL